jgi:two-component system NarL family sensor kinase
MSGAGQGERGPDVARVIDESAEPAWISVSAGSARSAQQRPVRTGRIVAQVIAAAAVVVVLVTVLGSIASRKLAEQEAVHDAANTTDLLADAVVQPAITDALAAMDPAAIASFDAVVRAHVLGSSIVRVKVWTPDGKIVYSDEPRVIGETFVLGEDERDVLTDPVTRAEISDLSKPENRFETGQKRLLEVYRPVWTPTGQPLLFETYARYDTVTSRTSDLWRGFAGITLTSLLLLIALLLPVLWRLIDRLRTAQTQREQLLQHAVDASADERQRIAANLHDGVVQELAASSFAVAGAAGQAQSLGHPGLAHQLNEVVTTVRASISGLRSLLVDIYPPNLRTAGLYTALDDLATALRARDVVVTIDVPDDVATRLSEDDERLIFRVAQECLRNTAKHAGATNVLVSLTRSSGAIVLIVADDGRGFDPSTLLNDPERGHFGLRILGDLAASSGAALDVASAPGEGTRWRLTLPRR